MDKDPYTYPGTDVLINKFDIRDENKLQEVEIALFVAKSRQPLPKGKFDYAHLKAIHQHYFSDLYQWAGQERTVDMGKGFSEFARTPFIEKEINKLFNQLNQTDKTLVNLEPQAFCSKAAHYFSELNAVHPFREGNGRTTRAFFELLAEKAGYKIDWSLVDRETYIKASILGFNGDNQLLENVFKQVLIAPSLQQAKAITPEKSELADQENAKEVIFQKYGKDVKIQTADSKNGNYRGEIIFESDKHIGQRLGANNFVLHTKKQLEGDYSKGKFVSIQYNNHKGLSIDTKRAKERNKEQGIER